MLFIVFNQGFILFLKYYTSQLFYYVFTHPPHLFPCTPTPFQTFGFFFVYYCYLLEKGSTLVPAQSLLVLIPKCVMSPAVVFYFQVMLKRETLPSLVIIM